jgi:hypothetical protein
MVSVSLTQSAYSFQTFHDGNLKCAQNIRKMMPESDLKNERKVDLTPVIIQLEKIFWSFWSSQPLRYKRKLFSCRRRCEFRKLEQIFSSWTTRRTKEKNIVFISDYEVLLPYINTIKSDSPVPSRQEIAARANANNVDISNRCWSGLSFNRSDRCIYNDRLGFVKPCRDGAHLLFCGQYTHAIDVKGQAEGRPVSPAIGLSECNCT